MTQLVTVTKWTRKIASKLWWTTLMLSLRHTYKKNWKSSVLCHLIMIAGYMFACISYVPQVSKSSIFVLARFYILGSKFLLHPKIFDLISKCSPKQRHFHPLVSYFVLWIFERITFINTSISYLIFSIAIHWHNNSLYDFT